MATLKARLGAEFLDYAHNLYVTQSDCDVLLIADENCSLHVHQIVLAAFSECFRVQFSEDARREIYIPDMEFAVLKALINFIYSGKLCINKQNAKSILTAALQLKISAAVDHIRRTHKKIKRLFDTNRDLEEIISANSDVLEEPTAAATDEISPGNVSDNQINEPLTVKRNCKQEGENEREEEEAMNVEETLQEELTHESEDVEQGENLHELKEMKHPSEEIPPEVKSKRKRKVFPCKECDQVFVHGASLKLHFRRRHGIPATCWRKSWHPIDFVRSMALRQSVRKIKSRKQNKIGNNYICKKCLAYFRYRSEYQAHFHQHLCPVSCSKCHKKFTKSELCRKHLQKHRDVRQCISHSCKHCGQSFKWISVLKRHKKEKHPSTNKTSLRCRHCKRTFKYVQALEAHLRHHGLSAREVELEFKDPGVLPNVGNVYSSKGTSRMRQQSLECKLCNRIFTTVYTLNLHSIRKHNHALFDQPPKKRSLKWACTVCEFKSHTATEMSTHMKQAHPQVMLSCASCKYQTPVKGLLDNHITTRHDTSSKKGHQCTECNSKFQSAYHLRMHLYKKHDIKHEALKVYTCPVADCSYTAFQRYIVDAHMAKHKVGKNVPCAQCQRKFKSQKNLESHIRTVHERIRPFICELCGASYGHEAELRNHIARHEKSLLCVLCDFVTSDKSCLQSHMWSKHRVQLDSGMKIFTCEQCGYSTDRGPRFKEHMLKHGEDRPVPCPECAKTFKSAHNLRSHMLWVHKKKKVKCEHCDHVTATMTNLREHVRIKHTHCNVKPFKCPYCDQLFGTAGNCRKHVACRHKDQPINVITVKDKYPNSRPLVGGQRNPHRANTIASFDYDIETLMNKEEEAPPAPPPQATPPSETSYVYALHFAPPPQQPYEQLTTGDDMLPSSAQIEMLPSDFNLSQQPTSNYQQLYSVVPQHENAPQTL
ncbi:hypothetical protein CAPTEDRAFT_227534 [Capitella teleta]|uniref:BTB domain-containing protein n=1 Tax=Capitella teleta TaxID=283909 RepID=R7UQF7_CAPTE|nr:hypothetical protein CAPTEDRAFT_227534 [Capitella teleta]|eukprot:ELU06162.1 hypothetical protein CAPTEDRAFT_227534 [Capitella teleta]